MSARESIENLWDRATPVGPLLDQYAHELAEKIRADLEASGDWTCCAAARRSAADLIDPERQAP
jgi:hypothetical protein